MTTLLRYSLYIATVLLCAQTTSYSMNQEENTRCQICTFSSSSPQAVARHMQSHYTSQQAPLDDYETEETELAEPARKKNAPETFSVEPEKNDAQELPIEKHQEIFRQIQQIDQATQQQESATADSPEEPTATASIAATILSQLTALSTAVTAPIPSIASSGRSFTCPTCQASIIGHQNFLAHKRTHKGPLTFKCTQEGCGYAAANQSDLTKHMRTHTGEKPFKCIREGCGYAAANQSNLTTHMRIHTKEKPYKCTWEGCGYAAAQQYALIEHMRTHAREKPYKCSQCVYSSTHRSGLRYHITHTHPQTQIAPADAAADTLAETHSDNMPATTLLIAPTTPMTTLAAAAITTLTYGQAPQSETSAKMALQFVLNEDQ